MRDGSLPRNRSLTAAALKEGAYGKEAAYRAAAARERSDL